MACFIQIQWTLQRKQPERAVNVCARPNDAMKIKSWNHNCKWAIASLSTLSPAYSLTDVSTTYIVHTYVDWTLDEAALYLALQNVTDSACSGRDIIGQMSLRDNLTYLMSLCLFVLRLIGKLTVCTCCWSLVIPTSPIHNIIVRAFYLSLSNAVCR